MDNKQVLDFILASDQLLNDYANVTRMDNQSKRKEELERILEESKGMQRVCYDPYIFATKDLGSDKMEYTCLVCGKNVGGSIPGHIVNLVEDGLIEGDHVAEYAVEQLKKYLTAVPALSEVEIREALRKDISEFIKQR